MTSFKSRLVAAMIMIMPLQVTTQDVLALENEFEKERFKLAIEIVLSIKGKNIQITQSLDKDYPQIEEDKPIVQLLYFGSSAKWIGGVVQG